MYSLTYDTDIFPLLFYWIIYNEVKNRRNEAMMFSFLLLTEITIFS